MQERQREGVRDRKRGSERAARKRIGRERKRKGYRHHVVLH